jgi:hypothetical protein
MRAFLIVLTLAAAACSSSGSGNNDGGGSDGPGLVSIGLSWELITANIQGGTNNGFAVACDDPMVSATMIAFTVQSSTGATVDTIAPCPAGQTQGNSAAAIPSGAGPYTLTAILPGAAMSKSERISGLTTTSSAHIRIYAFGCDAPMCQ